MISLHALTLRFFEKVVIGRPILVITCLFLIIAALTYHVRDFRLDASAETLVLEHDEDLAFSRMVDDRYGVEEFLIVTYTPKGELFSDATLKRLARLQEELAALPGISSVFSILNAPLLESPPVPVDSLAKSIRTLLSPETDRNLAKIEFQTSPLYRNLIVNPDFSTTALLLYLPTDDVYRQLLSQRNALRDKKADTGLTEAEAQTYQRVLAEFRRHHDRMRQERHRLIVDVRGILATYRNDTKVFLGGVSMIADDLISFIKKDIKIFGIGIMCFLIVILAVIFREFRWVFLPILCCLLSGLSMIGILGLTGWEVTVISSNFISLQLIITMAITLHLVVRYRELHVKAPEAPHRELVMETVRAKLVPCLYAALTTIAGFASLIYCNILPVITFGWMMTAGLVLSLVLTFLLFPPVLVLMGAGAPESSVTGRAAIVRFFAKYTERHGTLILMLSVILAVFSAIGISRLEVENSFIDYFKKTTEIYQGMTVIDQHLGGTTPLDVVIDLPPESTEAQGNAVAADEKSDIFDEFEEFESAGESDKYWFTPGKIKLAHQVHTYLESLPATGKVLSLSTMVQLAEKLNGGKPLDNFQLALLNKEIPAKYRNLLLAPYVSIEHNQLRFSVRIKDSEKSLRRNELLKTIKHDLIDRFGLNAENVRLAGMLVLYNNMLQSLFGSQIMTLGIVLAALALMFLILFRSIAIALIAIFPNLLSIGVVLGIMGWCRIPLDMMTITIAAISVGIAVDDTIHYIHRFKEEFHKDGNYIRTLHRCHDSIGYAMYYTSITIIIGFAILALSEFIPSIYFGMLTGLAMLIAMVVALTLLPQLLVFFKPYGPEKSA